MEERNVQKYQNFKLSVNSDIKSNEKDPVSQLSAIFGKIVWKSTLVARVHNKCCFNVSTLANGKTFRGTGTTLKMAKKACALSALANYYNSFDTKKNVQPYVLFPDDSGPKMPDKEVMIYEDRKRKSFLNVAGVRKNPLPLMTEEIEGGCKIEYKKDKKLNPLRNITNLPVTINSHLKSAEMNTDIENSAIKLKQKTLISKNICNKENNHSVSELGSMLRNKLKSNISKETLTISKFATMNMVNVQPVQMKVCINNIVRNSFEPLNLLSNEDIFNDSMVNNLKQVCKLKRPREEDASELVELPQAKRRAITSREKWCQQNENAVNYLRNLNPNLKFTLEKQMGSWLVPYFLMSAMVGDRKFFGHGKTKYLAKNNATKLILNYLENNSLKTINNTQANNRNSQRTILPNIPENEVSSSLLLPSHIADVIELKIMQRFNEITLGHNRSREYKVLAGIVMTFDMNFRDSMVVSIATGTKCVNGGNICCNGTVLNDSHAEIIAKRGLMKFLYAKLKCHCSENSYGYISIFQKNPNSLRAPYMLNPNIHFHLYINTAPCGDARIYSFNNTNSYNSAKYGKLRTKVEGKLGTIPVRTRYCDQTWDGVVLGEPLNTMSCSDKIALWNVVGIQGGLLSQFIDPIYLHSIVLGSMFNFQHIYRAICGRIERSLDYLPQPYRLHRPLLGQTSAKSRRSTYRAPTRGINWVLGNSDIEVISLSTGRTIDNEISVLSKIVFFHKFNYLCKNLPFVCIEYISDNYAEAKQNAKDYQKCKRVVFEAFNRAGLGTWIKKPIEQNEFIIN